MCNAIICQAWVACIEVDESLVCITCSLHVDAHVVVVPAEEAARVGNLLAQLSHNLHKQTVQSTHTTVDDSV